MYKGGRLSGGEGRGLQLPIFGESVICVGCETFQDLASLGSDCSVDESNEFIGVPSWTLVESLLLSVFGVLSGESRCLCLPV